MPQILLYNFRDADRLRAIRRYLNKKKVDVRLVQPAEYHESLGYLFNIEGFQKSPLFNLGRNFSEEMMVLKDFSQSEMDYFLAFFRENGLPSVNLKAVLTPVTVHWSSLRLHAELTQEHAAMHRNSK